MLIGVLGGGQLGRMLALAGAPLGFRFRFLDPSPDAPAGHVGELIVGSFDDAAAIARFSEGLDAATYEFENVPKACVEAISERVPVAPNAHALAVAQDRCWEKVYLANAGLAVAKHGPVDELAGLRRALERDVGIPAVLKTRRGGYDGKGQIVIRSFDRAEEAWHAIHQRPAILEELVPFSREVSLVAVRGRDGAFAAYPLVQNLHAAGILRTTTAPAPGVPPAMQSDAEMHMRTLMERLAYVGVLAVEFFECGGRLIANEMAPRVHNTGHWTIEGAATSQFENHCRAVAGLPLGDTRSLGSSVMINLIGDLPKPADVLSIPGAHLHLYGKEPRPGRKVGHVTVTGVDDASLAASVARVRMLPGASCAQESSPQPGAGR